MDSLTHIVLGAATGEIVLGKKLGNKALVWGAIAGSVPDFDSAITPLFNSVEALFVHRGFSHSLLFVAIAAPILGYIISKFHKEVNFRDGFWLSLWAILMHSLIDCFNTYGTALFEPFSNARLAFDSIGIIDFAMLIPIVVMLILIIALPQFSRKRVTFSIIILVFSFNYLLFSIGNKLLTEHNVKKQLTQQNITFTRLKTAPLPISNFLWLALAEDSLGYHYGYISNFDKEPITLRYIERNNEMLGKFSKSRSVNELIRFTDGFYTVKQKSDSTIWLNDLRFGSMAFESEESWFVFSFNISGDSINPVISRAHPNRSFGKETFKKYWDRLFRDIYIPEYEEGNVKKLTVD
jgi:inner membrane protein